MTGLPKAFVEFKELTLTPVLTRAPYIVHWNRKKQQHNIHILNNYTYMPVGPICLVPCSITLTQGRVRDIIKKVFLYV